MPKKVPRHPSFLLKIKITIVLLVCKSISSNHPFIYPTIHLFVYPSIHLPIYISIHIYTIPLIHLYTYPSIHQSIEPFIHLSLSLSLSLSLLLCCPLSFPSQFSLTHWHGHTFWMRSKRSSFIQSVSQHA
jgi:hypothetical protein